MRTGLRRGRRTKSARPIPVFLPVSAQEFRFARFTSRQVNTGAIPTWELNRAIGQLPPKSLTPFSIRWSLRSSVRPIRPPILVNPKGLEPIPRKFKVIPNVIRQHPTPSTNQATRSMRRALGMPPKQTLPEAKGARFLRFTLTRHTRICHLTLFAPSLRSLRNCSSLNQALATLVSGIQAYQSH